MSKGVKFTVMKCKHTKGVSCYSFNKNGDSEQKA